MGFLQGFSDDFPAMIPGIRRAINGLAFIMLDSRSEP
jgi:hypothetical protein